MTKREEDEVLRIPPAVEALAAGDPVTPVWTNQLGGRTFEVGAGRRHRFIKWNPLRNGIELGAEVARLEWASAYVTVPLVLEHGSDALGEWLVTEALPGTSAVDSRWRRDPESAVAAIGEALRHLHEMLPVSACPFPWDAKTRLGGARQRAARGQIDPAVWHEEHQALSVEKALALAADPPSIDQLVVCHGDACAPNTLLREDGEWLGHVDLGDLGVADRWTDLAVATWSTEWNYGPGWESTLLDAYGIAPDPDRTRYYRLLWDLG